jgi:hypothetical protein
MKFEKLSKAAQEIAQDLGYTESIPSRDTIEEGMGVYYKLFSSPGVLLPSSVLENSGVLINSLICEVAHLRSKDVDLKNIMSKTTSLKDFKKGVKRGYKDGFKDGLQGNCPCKKKCKKVTLH